jgi:CheY-like chemotaxis protein
MEPQTSSPPGPPDVRVLVVDDDESAREAIVRLIQTFGVRACSAQDGEEAFHLVPEVHPDLILCDLQMPRLDGFAFVKRLRRTPPFHRTLTVAVTGLSRAIDMAATREAGFDEHCVKPLNLEVIARLLARARESRHRTDQSPPDA